MQRGVGGSLRRSMTNRFGPKSSGDGVLGLPRKAADRTNRPSGGDPRPRFSRTFVAQAWRYDAAPTMSANPSGAAMSGTECRATTALAVDQHASPEAKIALFRALFRGRDDVYARRFESRRTGRHGYQPACGNEWVPGVCEKPRIRCTDCRVQRFLPITDEVVRWHLSGCDEQGRDFVAGIYPMLVDETCFFLAADFDGEQWRQDAEAFIDTCQALGLPAALERSRSGDGAHVWLFFEEALSAHLARRLGAFILTETMERRPEIGFESYDRFFPNQDTLPHGGLGNLIALPLQRQARTHGNSVFLDERHEPWPDQWAFLARIGRISRGQAEGIARKAETRGGPVGVCLAVSDDDDPTPWSVPPSGRRTGPPAVGPLPDTIDVVLGDEIYIAKEGLPPALRNRLQRLAAFQNPLFHRAQAMRLPTWDKPRMIACAEDHPRHVGLPRGCLEDLLRLLADLRIEPRLRDERFAGIPLDVAFRGELRPDQLRAAEAMAAHETGVLAATTAFGKTVVACWLLARRRVNTLVLVHRRQLLEQWIERLSCFLELPAGAVGRIGCGRSRPTGLVDVAVIQSLIRGGVVDDRIGGYGHLIVDECHHLSAPSFEQVARKAKARFVTGLSATVTRKDGHHPVIFMQCGPVRHRVDARAQAARRPFAHEVLARPTAFVPVKAAAEDVRAHFHDLCEELAADESRNQLICEDVVAAIKEGRSPIVLTERNAHLDDLVRRLAGRVRHVIVLRGGMGRRALQAELARLAAIPDAEERLILATGRFVGEGFDDARLDSLFLTMPVSWHGTIAQYVGRLHRLHDAKQEVRVHDYADLGVPMLSRMFDRRCRGYEAVGYTILLPASAVPGWPPGAPLPVHPEWKSRYGASVRRLVRDGVDLPLARLFAQTATMVPPDAEGADRARSLTEAFLFRRLETLPQANGRFRLNSELPIPFDGWGRLEVDLSCEDAHIAIEIDGGQHLADAEAYRRDRRKDQFLQEAGWFVLRFLAQDVAERLDTVLDAILRALAHHAAHRESS